MTPTGGQGTRLQREPADGGARGELALAARHEHERVGGAARAIMCDSWPVSGSSTTPSGSMRDARPHELVARVVPRQRRAEPSGQERRRRLARALECGSAGRTNSSKPTSDDTGLPGQPEHERRAARRERDRLARLHRDAPEHLGSRRAPASERAHEIVRPDRDAAGGDQHVRREPARERRARRVRVVGDRRRARSASAPAAASCAASSAVFDS